MKPLWFEVLLEVEVWSASKISKLNFKKIVPWIICENVVQKNSLL